MITHYNSLAMEVFPDVDGLRVEDHTFVVDPMAKPDSDVFARGESKLLPFPMWVGSFFHSFTAYAY